MSIENLEVEHPTDITTTCAKMGGYFEDFEWTTGKIIGVITGAVIFCVVCAALLGSSFSYIEWDEYALKKNTASNDVEFTKVYGNGRYFWGVNYRAVTFVRTIINVNFDDDDGNAGSLIIFTDTGLEIQVLCSFQYQLIKDNIPTMYINFGNTYEQQVISVARSILKNEAPNFVVEQYYEDRDYISQAFYNVLSTGLQQKAYVQLVSFQLRNILLADQIENKLLNIQIQLQFNQREQYVQNAAVIRTETAAMVSAVTSNVTVILNQANSTASYIRAKATANAFQIRETARKDGLAALFAALNITTTKQKLAYMYATGLSSSAAQLLVGTTSAIISVD